MKKVSVDWSIGQDHNLTDIDIATRRYKRYLEGKGFRSSTIEVM
jgi:hypothetical protein